jgi:precorrin-8X/cobalt-precorrin-8 methylmutase
MQDEDVAEMAKQAGTTRAKAAVDKAAMQDKPLIFAIGNAPTALMRICELKEAGKLSPELVIGVPVGFVNVVESKEALTRSGIPYITARGRKGGSNVAAAICNALLRIAGANKNV